MMKAYQWAWLPVAVVSTSGYATTYFTVEQAQKAIFPGLSFTSTGQPDIRTPLRGVSVSVRLGCLPDKTFMSGYVRHVRRPTRCRSKHQ